MIFCFFLCLTIACYGAIRYKNFYNPLFIFYTIWAIIIGLYNLNLFDLYRISSNTALMIFLGLVFWEIGFVASNVMPRIVIGQQPRPAPVLRERMFSALVIITLCLLAFSGFISLRYVLSGSSLADVRYRLRDSIIGFNWLFEILYMYFITPASYLIVHVCAINFAKKHRRALMLWITATTVVLSLLSEGGRFMTLYVAVDYLVILLIQKEANRISTKRLEKNKKTKLIYSLMVIASFALIYIITSMRNVNAFESFYKYVCGCLPLFDAKLKVFSQKFEFTYGLTSLNGFIRPVLETLQKLNTTLEMPRLFQVSESILLDVEKIGYIAPTEIYNGFVTMFYAFYADMGAVGICVYSILWGGICGRCYNSYRRERNDRSLLIYLLIVQALATSMLKFQFVSYMYALAYIYQLLLYRRPHSAARTTQTAKWSERCDY